MIEVCFLIGLAGGHEVILDADLSADPAALPDSRARWSAIWRHRRTLTTIAHTHPSGAARFSLEDETTMTAIDAALGVRLTYSVVTAGAMLRRLPDGTETSVPGADEPWWAGPLRAASGIRTPQGGT